MSRFYISRMIFTTDADTARLRDIKLILNLIIELPFTQQEYLTFFWYPKSFLIFFVIKNYNILKIMVIFKSLFLTFVLLKSWHLSWKVMINIHKYDKWTKICIFKRHLRGESRGSGRITKTPLIITLKDGSGGGGWISGVGE